MRTLFRILIIATCIGILLYYTNDDEQFLPLEGPHVTQPAIPTEEIYINDYQDAFSDPKQGISLLIGQSSEEILKLYGEPIRKDIAVHSNEWWIYQNGQLMISIENGQVNEVYTNRDQIDVSPYKIGQSIEDVYRMTMVDAEVSVTLGENVYMFAMSEQDMRNRLLVQFDTVYAQIYIDEAREVVAGIRFLDGEALVVHQPYEMQYMGNLVEHKVLSSNEQLELNKVGALQFYTLVNNFRQQYDLPLLRTFDKLNQLAMSHSEDMFLQQYMSHDSPTDGSLVQRLDVEGIVYKKASENIAMAYYDAIEAVHGLLNSEEHREELLSEHYNYVGTGVYYDYYTQIFIEQEEDVGK